MKTLKALCKSHRRRCYFEDEEGLIGVYNHRNQVLWYRWSVAGYSLTGSSASPQGAEMHYLS